MDLKIIVAMGPWIGQDCALVTQPEITMPGTLRHRIVANITACAVTPASLRVVPEFFVHFSFRLRLACDAPSIKYHEGLLRHNPRPPAERPRRAGRKIAVSRKRRWRRKPCRIRS